MVYKVETGGLLTTPQGESGGPQQIPQSESTAPQTTNGAGDQQENNNKPTIQGVNEQNGNATLSGQNINMDEYRPDTNNFGAGIKEAALDRFNRKNITNFAKNSGKRAIRGVAKGFGAALLGTAALGAAVATGDPKNALTYTTAGIAAGGKLSGRITNKGMNEAIRTGSAYKKGRLGGDEYNAKKTISELKNDRDFTSACRAVGIKGKDQEKLARQFMNNGITNKEDILKEVVAKKNYEKTHEDRISSQELIDLAVLNQGIGDSTWSDPEKREKIRQGLLNRGFSEGEVNRAITLISGIKSQ